MTCVGCSTAMPNLLAASRYSTTYSFLDFAKATPHWSYALGLLIGCGSGYRSKYAVSPVKDMYEEKEKDGMCSVYALGFVSFFTDTSSEIIFSVLPVFILSLSGSHPALLRLI